MTVQFRRIRWDSLRRRQEGPHPLRKYNFLGTYGIQIREFLRRHKDRKYHPSTWPISAPSSGSPGDHHSCLKGSQPDSLTCGGVSIPSNKLDRYQYLPGHMCQICVIPSYHPRPVVHLGASRQPVGLSLPFPRGLRSSTRVGEGLRLAVCDSCPGTPSMEINA
jgi:hypothetical protein